MENNEDMGIPEYIELDKIIEDVKNLLKDAKKITAELREEYKRKPEGKDAFKGKDLARQIQYDFHTGKIREKEHVLMLRLSEIVHVVREIPEEFLILQRYLAGIIPQEKISAEDSNLSDVFEQSIHPKKTIYTGLKKYEATKHIEKLLSEGQKIEEINTKEMANTLEIDTRTAAKYLNDPEILQNAEQWKNKNFAQQSRKSRIEKIKKDWTERGKEVEKSLNEDSPWKVSGKVTFT